MRFIVRVSGEEEGSGHVDSVSNFLKGKILCEQRKMTREELSAEHSLYIIFL